MHTELFKHDSVVHGVAEIVEYCAKSVAAPAQLSGPLVHVPSLCWQSQHVFAAVSTVVVLAYGVKQEVHAEQLIESPVPAQATSQ